MSTQVWTIQDGYLSRDFGNDLVYKEYFGCVKPWQIELSFTCVGESE